MIRTHQAGNLRSEHAGQQVTLAGWVASRRDHGGVAFLDLRDASGVVQVVVHDPEVAHPLRDEFCVKVVGTVSSRPEGNENPDLPTGAIEVMVEELEVLSTAAPLPFPIDDRVTVGEETRLRHRYLDLRRKSAGDAIRMRSKVNQICRDVLLAEEFLEIETPTLTRSTPEGARDFLVPVRLQPGHWYALPQSPQLFKQLLMVAGMERYFQIARCYRDEDFRGDRQPEFTQLDIEMSFVEQADVIAVGEAVVRALWQGVLGHDIGVVPHMTYAEAMRRYGSDKPDLRFGLELVDVTVVLRRDPLPGVPGRARRGRRDARGSGPAAQAVRRVAGVGQAARRQGPRLRDGPRGRHPGRSGRQEHQRCRARWPGGRGGGRARRLRVLRRRPHLGRASPPRSCPAGDRPSARAHRRGRLVLRLDRRRADVRGGSRGRRRARLDGGPPSVHLAEHRVDRPVRGGAG